MIDVLKDLPIEKRENKTKIKQCCECRKGEHDNIDNNVTLCHVKNPDTNKFILRAYLCENHQEAYLNDGYIVKKIK